MAKAKGTYTKTTTKTKTYYTKKNAGKSSNGRCPTCGKYMKG